MTSAPAITDFVPVELDAAQWENLQPLYQTLLERQLTSAAGLEQLLLDRSELDAAASEARAILYINMTCHTDDEAKKHAYLDFVEEVDPQLEKIGFEIDRKITSSPYTGEIDQSRHEVLLRDLGADVELFREENVPLKTEDTKLGQQYSEICGAMMVNFQGEEFTMPQMAKFAEQTDRKVREGAWRASVERRYQDHEKHSAIFDEMISLRDSIGRNAGFDNYRDYMFKVKHRFDYSPTDCEDFHRAAEEVCVPLLRKLNADRAEALGVETLRPWDLAVDIKGRDPLRPFENDVQLVEKTSKLFHRMNPAIGAMFDTLRDGESLDLESRKSKAPGGYQESFDRRRKQFIFMNAAGLQRDLETMVHEAGHAFHSMLCKGEPLLHYRHPPLEFCEVASMSMEMLAYPYLDEFYDAAEVARAKRDHLEGIVKVLPWIATIDAFQHWLYTHPDHSRKQRTECWLDLDERFGSAVNWEGLENFRAVMWQRQLHLFEVPFYYIEYGIAQLGAMQLWLNSKKNEKNAIEHYTRAMRLGGSRPLPELFEAAGLTFDFGPGIVSRLIEEVQQELDALPV